MCGLVFVLYHKACSSLRLLIKQLTLFPVSNYKSLSDVHLVGVAVFKMFIAW